MRERPVIGNFARSPDPMLYRIRGSAATVHAASSATTARASARVLRIALAVVALAALPACAPNHRGTAVVDRHDSTMIGSSGGEATSDVSELEPPRLDRPAPPRTLSTWLEVEIAGGRTWLNLDRVESISVPSILNPVGRLPILIVHYGSGRKVELAFDDDTQRAESLRRIQATLTIAREPR